MSGVLGAGAGARCPRHSWAPFVSALLWALREDGVTGPAPPSSSSNTPTLQPLHPRSWASPSPLLFIPRPPIYCIEFALTVSLCMNVPPWDVANLTYLLPWSCAGSFVTVLASAQGPAPHPVPSRASVLTDLKLPSDSGCATLGHSVAVPASRGPDLSLSRGPVPSEHQHGCNQPCAGAWPGPGAPDPSSSWPYCQMSSVLSAFALHLSAPLPWPCPPRGAEAAVPYCCVSSASSEQPGPLCGPQFSPLLLHEFFFVHIMFFPN